VPTPVDPVTVVEHVGCVVSQVALWPRGKAEKSAVTAGGVPYVLEVEVAVMVRGHWLTLAVVSEPKEPV
jgi:hypothetical protein